MQSKIQNRKSAIPIIPDGLEPSFSGCKPGVVATGPRDQIESGLTGTRTRRVQIEKRLACDASIFLLDDESFMSSGSRGTRTHNGFHSSPVFNRCSTTAARAFSLNAGRRPGLASSRVTSNSCGGRNRTCRLVVQSNGFLPTETTPHRAKGRAGLEPTQWCLTGTCSATELPTQIKSALRESNPPVQLGRLAPLPLGQGHVYSPSSGSRGT